MKVFFRTETSRRFYDRKPTLPLQTPYTRACRRLCHTLGPKCDHTDSHRYHSFDTIIKLSASHEFCQNDYRRLFIEGKPFYLVSSGTTSSFPPDRRTKYQVFNIFFTPPNRPPVRPDPS